MAASPSTSKTLVVSKLDNAQYAVVDNPGSTAQLAPRSVRVKTRLISVTSNNLSYARGGAILHWWDTYPVPDNVVAPYQDESKWGIVPAWGYGEVVETTTDSLMPGTLLWGFWPMSSRRVDLKLVESDPAGYWREESPHRNKLMEVYNTYVEVDHATRNNDVDDSIKGWTASLSPVFATGYQLHRYVFPSSKDSASITPQHPFGYGNPWTAEDADLTASVVVSLSAATKTGRGFAWQILRNRATSQDGPLGFVQVTSDPASLWSPGDETEQTNAKAISYKQLSQPDTLSWIADCKPKRIVLVDFGAASSVIETFTSSIETSNLFDQAPSILLIGVGSEMRVVSNAELSEKTSLGQKLGRIQFNSGGIREKGVEMEGSSKYFSQLDRSFDAYIQDQGTGKLRLKWGHGIGGVEGIEGAWKAVCAGKLSPHEACVFKI